MRLILLILLSTMLGGCFNSYEGRQDDIRELELEYNTLLRTRKQHERMDKLRDMIDEETYKVR